MLHRIEALAGEGRYALTFRRPDGSEQAAVAQIDGADDAVDAGAVAIAESALPPGWTAGSPAALATVEAVAAVHRARRALAPDAASLRDVDGGWDVGLGNVVLTDGVPTCTAHGAMTQSDDVWVCAECGARAAYR